MLKLKWVAKLHVYIFTKCIFHCCLDSTRNLFHSTGGLLYVLELLFEPQSATEVQQAALYTLGCAADRNRKLKLESTTILAVCVCVTVVVLRT